MNITKKSKILTKFIVAIACVAVVMTACLVFVPKLYKGDDADLSKTASLYDSYENGGYGMKTVTYTKDNSAFICAWMYKKKSLAWDSDDNGWYLLQFPTEIYIDKNEDLSEAGYYYKLATDYTTCNKSYGSRATLVSDTVFGLFKDRATYPGNSDTLATAIMDLFPTYGFAATDFVNCSVEMGQNDSKAGNNATRVIISAANASLNFKMQGKANKTGEFVFDMPNTKRILWWQYKGWTDLGDDVLSGANYDAASYSDIEKYEGAKFANGYTQKTDINISITCYDKSGLFNSIKSLDKKYSAVENMMSDSEKTRYETFQGKVKDLLAARKTNQTEIDNMKKRVDEYIFILNTAAPDTYASDAPYQLPYIGSAYEPQAMWSKFVSQLTSKESFSDFFNTPTVKYGEKGFTATSNPDGTRMTNAGYYQIVFQPKRTTCVYTSGTAGAINVRLGWEGDEADKDEWEKNEKFVMADPAQVTCFLQITKAELGVSIANEIARTFMGDTPNVVRGLPAPEGAVNPSYTMIRQDLNPPVVQLSLEPKGLVAGAWDECGDSVELEGVGTRIVYYRVSATNHKGSNDKDAAYGSFKVNIKPADISVKLKGFEMTYGETLLTSEQIFDEMLASDTPNILDSKSAEKTLDYLTQMLTFAVLTHDGDGSVFQPSARADAGSYTITAILKDDWKDKINEITMIGAANAYVINPKEVTVTWTHSANRWYTGVGGHRPSAVLSDESKANDVMPGDEAAISSVSLVGEGRALDSEEAVKLVGGRAVYAGRYIAEAIIDNDNYTITNATEEFRILQRSISLVINDKERTYAALGTAEETQASYNNTLAENTDNNAYTATLSQEIAEATSNTKALVDPYNEVFGVIIDAERIGGSGEDEYFVVGEHTFRIDFNGVKSRNYLLESATNGKYTITPAAISVTLGTIPTMTYNGDYQDAVIAKSSKTIEVAGYEKGHFEDSVTIKYSSASGGPYSETPIQIKDVKDAPRTVYYEVSAPNHTSKTGSFVQNMRAVNITIVVGGQTEKVVYGTPIPDSDSIKRICNISFLVEGRSIQPVDRAIDPSVIFEFYLINPENNVLPLETGAIDVDADSYTVTHRLASGVSEDIDNFNVIYPISEETHDRVNVEAYTISKKDLYIDWRQNGERWQGEDKDEYVFSNSVPLVYPTADPDYVVGDDFFDFGYEEIGAYVNAEGYEVVVSLVSGGRNDKNYELKNPAHTFRVVKLDVYISIYDIEVEYGKSQLVELGMLVDPTNPNAKWCYAAGHDATFYVDHYRNWYLNSAAVSDDGSFADVKEGGYPIGILPGADADNKVVTDNYEVHLVKEEGKTATFTILQAEVKFVGKEFNINSDAESGERKYITIDDLTARLSTGIKGVGLDQFDIKMSKEFYQNQDIAYDDAALQWVNQTTAQEIGTCARYYVWFIVENKAGNFKPFREKIGLNVLSDWISVTIAGGITDAEYGEDVFDSDEIFANLTFANITGTDFMIDSQPMFASDPDLAIQTLKNFVTFYVGKGGFNDEKMDKNGEMGDYTIYMDIVAGSIDPAIKGVRFLGDSNINAYHVGPRAVVINWEGLDEIYGSHGNSHDGYSLGRVIDGDDVRLNLVHDIYKSGNAEEDAKNNASFRGGHAFTAGTYTVYATSLNNPNYKLPDDEEARGHIFTISPKTIHIELVDREFVYGASNSHKDQIGGVLNINSQTPYYQIVDRDSFVGTDRRIDIFNIIYKVTNSAGDVISLPVGVSYLPVSGEDCIYVIDAKLADTEVAKNYILEVVKTGALTITPAKIGLNVNKMPTMYFNAREQSIAFNRNWFDVKGDSDSNRQNAVISYAILERDDWRVAQPVFELGDVFTIKDAGRYKIQVLIQAPNHEDYYSGNIDLDVVAADVIIKLNSVSKTYGQKLVDFTTDSLSDWLKKACNVNITSYRYVNGERIEEDITKYAMNDFEFYICDHNNPAEYAPLEIGNFQSKVDEYTIYHQMSAANNALASNYNVKYYRGADDDADCNVGAYIITPRDAEIKWIITYSDINWKSNNEYYYTGQRPTMLAYFETIPDADNKTDKVILDFTGNGVASNFAANAEGEHYTATAILNKFTASAHAVNYNLTSGNTFDYTILPRPIEVTLNDQTAGVYGKVKGNYALNQDAVEMIDSVISENSTSNPAITFDDLVGIPFELIIDGVSVGADEFLPAGSYHIVANTMSGNYAFTFKNKDGSEDYALLKVEKANSNVSLSNIYRGAKYLGAEFTLDFKAIIGASGHITSATFVDKDYKAVWDSEETIVTYLNEVSGEYTTELPAFDRAGVKPVSYKIDFKNYKTVSGTCNIYVQKGHAYLSFFTGASSAYGDDIYQDKDALSARIFEQARIAYGEGSDELIPTADELLRFYIEGDPVNAGRYTISFEFINPEDADNFEFTDDIANGSGNKYLITPKVISVEWNFTEGDSYVYDFKQHEVTGSVVGVLDGDTIDPKYASVIGRDAGTYTAKLIGIGENDNYAMPEEELRIFEWIISPRPILVEWSVEEYTYDTDSHVPSAMYLSGLLEGDNYGRLRVTGSAVNAGIYTAMASTTSGNYVVENNQQTFIINPRPIGITWGETNFIYNGESQAPLAVVNARDLLTNVECNVIVGGAQKNVGSYTAIVESLSDSNYVVVEDNSTSFVISPKKVNIHWSDTEFDYTGKEIAPEANIEGVVSGDSVELIVKGGAVDAKSGAYTATATGLDNPNYVLADNCVKSVEFTINKSRNEFVDMPIIGAQSSSMPWTGDNVPTSKFGNVVVKYYTDSECTKEYSGDINKAKEGSYWVKAFVEGSSNYDALESKAFEVNIVKGFNVAAVVTLIVLSAVMLAAVLAVVLIVGKKKGGVA